MLPLCKMKNHIKYIKINGSPKLFLARVTTYNQSFKDNNIAEIAKHSMPWSCGHLKTSRTIRDTQMQADAHLYMPHKLLTTTIPLKTFKQDIFQCRIEIVSRTPNCSLKDFNILTRLPRCPFPLNDTMHSYNYRA